MLELPEGINEFLSNSITKIFLITLWAHIDERQHNDRLLLPTHLST